MADFGGNLVGWEGCVCGVQGICDHCKGKLRGGLKAEWNVQEEMDTSSWGGETGCVPRGDVDIGKKGWVFFHGQSCIFSQWAKCSMKLRGVTYSSAEQFMMKCKADIGGDFHAASLIMRTDRPAEQKHLGRGVKRAIMAGWDSEKWDVVREGNLAKFRQNSGAREQLFWTKGRILVEASPTDLVWGAGVKMYDSGRDIQGTWKGKNWLGFLLTEVREQLLVENGGATSLPQGWKELCRKGLWGRE